jgi:hypothetical protein
MNLSIHNRIKSLIEQTNDAYSAYDTVNADYAEFAAMALSEFKDALHDPQLTSRQLMSMLRTAAMTHKDIAPKSCWATFMAYHIARTANNGGADTVSSL